MFILFDFRRIRRRFATLVKDRRLWKILYFLKRKILDNGVEHLLKYVTVSDHPFEKHKHNTSTPTILCQLEAKCPKLETIKVYEDFLIN